MFRRVFFSFHYQRDVFRANQVRMSNIVDGRAAAGFEDASLWEKARTEGDAAVKSLIDKALVGTTVTAVLIGPETFSRKYIDYEIRKSLDQQNGLLGIRIHMLQDHRRQTCLPGRVPDALVATGAPVYDWDYSKFGERVERAAAVSRRVAPQATSPSSSPWPAIGLGALAFAVLALLQKNAPLVPPSPINPALCPNCGTERVATLGGYYCAVCRHWGA